MKLAPASKAIRNSSILDENGRPIPMNVRRPAAPANPRGSQTFSLHTESGLTIESLSQYQRQAEDGRPVHQMDLWDGLIERHAEVRGMFNERREDVAGGGFCILPGAPDVASKKAAEALNEYLQYSSTVEIPSPSENRCTSFRRMIEHQLSSIPFGYAGTNHIWDVVDGLIVPVEYVNVAPRRFAAPSPDRAHEIWLVDAASSGTRLIELMAGTWTVTTYTGRNPYAAGLMRSCSWWMFFGLMSFKDWQVFADMFGLPLAVGYYEDGAGQASRDALEESVRSIGQDGYAVLSSLTELVIKETVRSGDSTTVYPAIMRACDSMLTKLITGGTLNTDVSSTGAGSYNAATVHASRGFVMKRNDARLVCESFASSIAPAFIKWNGFDRAAPPVLHFGIERGGLDRAKELEILGQAVPLSLSQIREEHGLREPSDAKDEVKFEQRKADPTSGPDGKKKELP